MPLAFLTHQPHPFLIHFTENIGIRYYGLSYMLGFLAAGWLLYLYAKAGRSHLPVDKISDLIIAMVFGVMLGGRLGSFLLYHPEQLASDPLSFFRVWEGGMASHGGFLGVAVALAWFAKSNKVSFLHLADLVNSTAAAGLLFGRLANFLNGELWGKESLVPWAMIFSKTGGGTFPRHPSQIYEAMLEGALLFAFLQWRFWRSNIIRDNPGRLTAEFLIGYALARIVSEMFREPDAGVSLILGLSRGTFYSVFMILGGVILIVATRPRKGIGPGSGP